MGCYAALPHEVREHPTGMLSSRRKLSPVFFGTYTHNLDNAGRLTVPSKLREAVAASQHGPRLFLTYGAERCIVAYTQERIAEILESAKGSDVSREEARGFKRIFGGEGAMETWDKQGRIILPDGLKQYAGIDKAVTIVGAMDCIEIWDAETYEKRRAEAQAAYDKVAGKVIR